MVTSDPSVIQRAVDMGINHFDTARVYQRGNNEHMVGAALKERRRQIILSSKAKGADKATALAQLDESLQALGTDYLDIWYLHDKRAAGDVTDDLIEAQQIAKQKGKIRFAGVSYHSAHQELTPVVAKHPKVDVVLITYNFAQTNMAPLIDTLAKAGKGVIAMKVMAGSINVDPSFDPQTSREKLKKPGAYAAALKFVLRHPGVHCAIPSIKDMDQLEENFAAMSQPFSGGDAKLLAAHLERIRPLYCRMCGSCSGTCPKGVPVADMMRFVTYAEGYGEYALGRENYLELPEHVRAVRCRDCTGCKVQCPNGVRVAERMIRAQELFA
jgi:predicted aldo/keto reductase-like oxidoreductase